MDTYKTYAERIIQTTPVILGLKLLPFSLGHSMILKAANSCFMVGGINELTDKQIIGELVFGLLVCSTTYDEFIADMNNGAFERDTKDYVSGLVDEIKATDMFCLNLKINAFANYIKTGTSTPYYYETNNSDSDIKNSPVEIEQSIVSCLMSECNYTRNQCLNLPLTETLSAFLLYAHKQGTIALQSKAEWELVQKLKGSKCPA